MAVVDLVIILRKLRTLRKLGGGGAQLILEALLVPIVVSAGFRVVGVTRTQAWLRRWALAGDGLSYSQDPASTIPSVRRAQRIVKRNFRIEGSCLERSLTLWALLLRRGLPTDLRVGFRKSAGKLEGHAWIEYGDVPLNETKEVRETYSVFKDAAVFDQWQKPDLWN
jgi:Transglutaminase-like superfamily